MPVTHLPAHIKGSAASQQLSNQNHYTHTHTHTHTFTFTMNRSAPLFLLASLLLFFVSALLSAAPAHTADLGGSIDLEGGLKVTIPTGSHTVGLTSLSTPLLKCSLTVENSNSDAVVVRFGKKLELAGGIDFPKGSKNFGLVGLVRIGFHITLVSPDNAVAEKIKITWKYNLGLISGVDAIIRGSVKAFGMQFDAETETYFVLGATTTSSSREITFSPQWPKNGREITFYIVGFDIREEIPCAFDYFVDVTADANSELMYRFGKESDLVLRLKSKNSFRLTASKHDSDPHPKAKFPSRGMRAIGYFSVESHGDSKPDFSGTIEYKFSADVVSKVDINTLKLAYYDAGAKAWVYGEGDASVDAEARVVSQGTDRLGMWAALGVSSDAASTAASLSTMFFVAAVAILMLLL